MCTRYAWGLVGLLWLGCASARENEPVADPVIERVGLPGEPTGVRIDVDRNPARSRIGVSRADSWSVIGEVFDSLNIRLEFADPGAFRAGNSRFIAPRQIARRPKSIYLRCGSGPGGQLADSHRVTMSLITELRSVAADATDVFTQIVASASTAEGTSTESVVCASTGTLERTLAQLLERRAQARMD